jgi:heterodisulfide reductase subunit A
MISGAGVGPLIYRGRKVRAIAYIYCVGSRQGPEVEKSNRYCSRYCCNAAVHAASLSARLPGGIDSYHLYRDIRTYGKFEELYEDAASSGSIFLRFDPGQPPVVASAGDGLKVNVKDLLTGDEEIEIPVDLVVLVTGMIPADNDDLTSILRLPLGTDSFYNEIHAKLRPVETVIDGVYLAGSCQSPKNATESVISSLSAVSKAASLLVKGYVDLQPFVAFVRNELCTWCGECEPVCPYNAISKIDDEGREIAYVTDVLCKGCGACLPVCAKDALQLKGFTDEQIMSMIEGFAREVEDV